MPTKRGRTPAIVGWGLIAVGVCAIGVFVAVIVGKSVSFVKEDLTGPTYTTPMDRSLHLKAGRYLVFERTGTQAGGGGVTFSSGRPVTITPDDVTITAPDGTGVSTGYPSGSQTISRGGGQYTGAVTFRATTSGTYHVQVTSAEPTSVIVAHDIGAGFLSVLKWIAGALGGLVVVVIGIVVLVVSATRRRAATAPSGPTLPPPGWYADPANPGRWRWWNGHTWSG